MTDRTTERGEHGAQGRPPLRLVTGTTLYMTTEELLAVLEEGQASPRPDPPHRVGTIDPAPRPPEPIRTQQRVIRLTQPPAPPPRPGLLRRLRCGRRGHDPRPHRLTPHGPIVYRCLGCGMQMSEPKS